MSLDGCVAIPHGAMGLSAVRDCGISSPSSSHVSAKPVNPALSHCSCLLTIFAIFLLCLSDFALLYCFSLLFAHVRHSMYWALLFHLFSPHPPLNQGLAILDSHRFGILSNLSLP